MKKVLLFMTILLSSIMFIPKMFAASMSVSASATTLNVSDSVTISVSLNNIEGKFRISSSDTSVLDGGLQTDWVESGYITATFTAKKAGSATITVTPITATTMDPGNEQDYTASKSVTIRVVEPSRGNSGGGSSNNNSTTKKNKQSYDYGDDTIDINKEYSSDNYLSSLSIEGYNIDFDKEKTEYTLDVDEDVTSVNITANPSDDKANVIGTGNIKLTDGINNVSITVIAENGNERVYHITINVKDINPIKVKIGKKEYSVVKKVEQLTAPDNFSPIEADIDDKKVPALYNEITGYILVGLKDDKGNVKLYVYDPKSKKYTLYHEITSSSIKLYYTKASNVPKGLKKTKIKINGESVTAYKSSKKSDFYLVYGMNVNTGDIGWYRYDATDKTLQRYETRDLENLSMLNNKYLITITFLSTAILMLMLFLLILFSRLKHMK